jgi:hypothetical protein
LGTVSSLPIAKTQDESTMRLVISKKEKKEKRNHSAPKTGGIPRHSEALREWTLLPPFNFGIAWHCLGFM